MPGLKSFLSSIKLGKGKQQELEFVEGQPALKRANAKLRKRNRGGIAIQNALGLVQEDPHVQQDVLRQNSFEPGQSLRDFDAKAHAFGSLHRHRSNNKLRPRDTVIPFLLSGISDSDVGANVVKAPGSELIPHTLSRQEPNAREASGPVLGRYGLEVHNWNLASTPTIQERSFFSENPYHNAAVAQESWTSISLSGGSRLSGSLPIPQQGESSKTGSKKKVSHVHELDWGKINEEDISETKDNRDFASTANPVSPADSGIAFAQEFASKDKTSIDDSIRRSERLSAAVDAWLAAEVMDDRTIASFEPDQADQRGIEDDGKECIPCNSLEPESDLAADFRSDRASSWDLNDEDWWEASEDVAQLEVGWLQQWAQEREDQAQARLLTEQLRKEQEEDDRLAAARARLRDCVVCGESLEPLDFPAKPSTQGCEHSATTCKVCLESWMESEFESKGCDGVRCPECPQILNYVEVQAAASAATFEAYDKLATRIALGDLDEFAWCLKTGCGSGQLNVNNLNFMDCASCGYKQCLKHKIPWHSGETCAQFQYRVSGQRAKDEEKETLAMLDTVSKLCPGKRCGWRIQKIDGCEHMKCKRCKSEFCWQCLADHKEIKRVGNTAHAPGCKFHSDNLEVAWPFNVH